MSSFDRRLGQLGRLEIGAIAKLLEDHGFHWTYLAESRVEHENIICAEATNQLIEKSVFLDTRYNNLSCPRVGAADICLVFIFPDSIGRLLFEAAGSVVGEAPINIYRLTGDMRSLNIV